MRILFVESDGRKVTQWFRQCLREIADVVFVDSLEDCDAVCIGDLTTNCHDTDVSYVAKYSREYGSKPLFVFLHDDPDSRLGLVAPNPHFVVFRTSILASQMQVYEHFLPSFQCEDNGYRRLAPFEVSDPNAPISVGFVGARTSQDRIELCALLSADARFQTDFVFRGAFHGHFDDAKQKQNEAEYKHNLERNLYQLCCRGAGNFSHRFYEVLASGRVPVLPDTDFVIPPHIPSELWRNCVVMASNIKSVPDALHAFHITHDSRDVQANCWRMWNTYLSYKGFANVVQKQLQTHIC